MKRINTIILLLLCTVASITNISAQSTADKIESLEMNIQLALIKLYDNKPYLNEEYNYEKNEYGEDTKVRRFCWGFFFDKGDLLFRRSVDKQIKAKSGSDYNNFEQYEFKCWIPVKNFDRIVYHSDGHFTIWTNVESSVKFRKVGKYISPAGNTSEIDESEAYMGVDFYPDKLDNLQNTLIIVNEALKQLKKLYLQ